MSNSSIFKRGLPYGPDRKLLADAFPLTALVEGFIIPHEALENLLGYKRGEGRYYPAINSWRKQLLRDYTLVVNWEPMQGLKVLSHPERYEWARKSTLQGMTQLNRRMKRYAYVDRAKLSEEERPALDHDLTVVNSAIVSNTAYRRQMVIELPKIESLPKKQLTLPD